MDKETIANLAIGGGVTGVFTYIANIFTKRYEKEKEMDIRLSQLEVELSYIKEVQGTIQSDIKIIIDTLTDLRVQLGTPKTRVVRNKAKLENDNA